MTDRHVTAVRGKPRPRMLRPCNCLYQKEKPWGYAVFKWSRERWKAVANAASLPVAYDQAERFAIALILCRGCGNEFHRDHPPVAEQKQEGGK